MKLGIPQMIVLGMYMLSLGIALAKNGEKRENYNFGISFIGVLTEIGLLYWGGFFK